MDSERMSEIHFGRWAGISNDAGLPEVPTFRMLSFCSHPEELAGIERD
jgi:hypothetical protein